MGRVSSYTSFLIHLSNLSLIRFFNLLFSLCFYPLPSNCISFLAMLLMTFKALSWAIIPFFDCFFLRFLTNSSYLIMISFCPSFCHCSNECFYCFLILFYPTLANLCASKHLDASDSFISYSFLSLTDSNGLLFHILAHSRSSTLVICQSNNVSFCLPL